jgi:hypothetical protein
MIVEYKGITWFFTQGGSEYFSQAVAVDECLILKNWWDETQHSRQMNQAVMKIIGSYINGETFS